MWVSGSFALVKVVLIIGSDLGAMWCGCFYCWTFAWSYSAILRSVSSIGVSFRLGYFLPVCELRPQVNPIQMHEALVLVRFWQEALFRIYICRCVARKLACNSDLSGGPLEELFMFALGMVCGGDTGFFVPRVLRAMNLGSICKNEGPAMSSYKQTLETTMLFSHR